MKKSNDKSNDEIVVLIPSLNPGKEFIDYAKELTKNNNVNLIVIDDGSREEFKYIFEEIGKCNKTVVLTHAVNLGKGRGLKTGFNYYINNFDKKKYPGIITADSDGQHKVEDVLAIGKELAKMKGEGIILGTRDFNLDNVPFKSRNGNKITTFVFKLLYGKKINDTQTGLRGISYDFAKKCISMEGERFDYEINMLIKAVREKVPLYEHTIETVYFDNNSETHFHPIRDSWKIYKVMLREFFKFTISGLSSALLDIILFTIFYNLFNKSLDVKLAILVSTICARILSSLYNYNINKNVVFQNKAKNTITKYYILCACQAFLSWLLVDKLFEMITIPHPSFVKVIVDFILFLVSYKIQQNWVFKNKAKE